MCTIPFIILMLCGILLDGNGIPYGNLFSKYEDRDDYYEDYYLRRIPKLKTSPDKVKEFFANHLTWFPMDSLEVERANEQQNSHNRRSYFVNLQLEDDFGKLPNLLTTPPTSTKGYNITRKVKEKFKKIKNYTETHHIHANWTSIKAKSSNSMHKVKNYVEKKHMKQVLKNVTHPLRYRGPMKHHSNHSNHPHSGENCYKYLGPSIRIHPKSSHVEVIKTSSTTEFPFLNTHLSIPRRIKVVIDLKTPEKPTESGGKVNDNDSNINSPQTVNENNSRAKSQRKVNEKNSRTKSQRKAHEKNSKIKSDRKIYERNTKIKPENDNTVSLLETAGQMASILAGKMTSLWHCMLGNHRIPDTKDVKFYLYTRRNVIQPELLRVNYDLISRKVRDSPHFVDVDCVDLPPDKIGGFERVSDANREIIKSNFLNINAPTKILIHGYTGSYKDIRMVEIKDAYLSNGRYNVIQVDWETLAAPPCYIRVTHHSRFVGEIIAKFLDGLHLIGLNMSLVHLVGFSLGAQVAGFVGNNATKVPVCRITGLDPALPLFLHTDPSGHLDKLDAKFVDVIHTCGGILAMLDPLGHVDFYPNGGTRQPGCDFSNLKCSHSRSLQYFAESVISQKKFTGQLCLNWEEYVAGNCDTETNVSFMGEPCSRRSTHGKYYLLTKSKEPFVL